MNPKDGFALAGYKDIGIFNSDPLSKEAYLGHGDGGQYNLWGVAWRAENQLGDNPPSRHCQACGKREKKRQS